MKRDLDACVDFLQRLIRIPSLPGREGPLAELVRDEMQALGYEEVYVDEAGNVIGRLRGRGEAPAVMFNTHLDHVDVGDPAAWPHPPFGGEIHNGCVWGRGAVDIKGPLAAQVYGIARLVADEAPLPGDVYVTAVVQEEVGGLGARHLLTHLRPPLVVVGEPSGNALRRGHRGRIVPVLHARGRSAHASAPERGANPLDVVARFIQALPTLEHTYDPDLGPSTVAPTLIRTDQTSSNVIPGEAWLTLDWRNVPGESDPSIRRSLNRLARDCQVDGTTAEVTIPTFPLESYTGVRIDMTEGMPPFIIREDHPALRAASDVLETALGAAPEADLWAFATDGGNFARGGLTCIGFAPGDETLAHTVNEHIPIDQFDIALDAYAALARHWGAAVARR